MSDSCLKISDFGLSKYLTQDDSSMTSNVGTRKFSAPEVEEGRTDYGISADIWSLGIIAYFLSTGSLPDKGEGAPVLYFTGRRKIVERWGPNMVTGLGVKIWLYGTGRG